VIILVVVQDGYHKAKIIDLKTKGDRVEIHFLVDNQTLKYRCSRSEAINLLKKLTGKEDTNLNLLIGLSAVIETKTDILNKGNFQIVYSKIVKIYKETDIDLSKREGQSKFDPHDWSLENALGIK